MAWYKRILIMVFIGATNYIVWQATLWILANGSGKGVAVLTNFANQRANELRTWYYGEDIFEKGKKWLQYYFFPQPPAPQYVFETCPSCDYFLLLLLLIGVWDGYLWYFLHMNAVSDREAVSAFFRLGSLAFVTGVDLALHYSPSLQSNIVLSWTDTILHHLYYFGVIRFMGIIIFWYFATPKNAALSLRRSLNGLYYTALFELGTDIAQNVLHLDQHWLLLIGIIFLAVHILVVNWGFPMLFDKLSKTLKGFKLLDLLDVSFNTVQQQEEEEPNYCIICTDISEDMRLLGCRHKFCEDCIIKLKRAKNPKCPVCRAPITDFPTEINNYNDDVEFPPGCSIC